MKQLLATISASILLLVGAEHGYAEGMDNIYQVEVIIFERLQRNGSNDGEYWPKNIELSYPQNRINLMTPGQEAEHSGATANTGSTVRLNTFLAPKHKDLNGKKDALDKQQGYRILFHQTWLQRLLPPASAPALIIRGGNTYGDHSELEGYISVGLSRYLHFQSHLWLTEFVANFGQPLEHWPNLPTLTDSASARDTQQRGTDTRSTPGEQKYYDANKGEPGQPRLNQWSPARDDAYAAMREAPYLTKSIAVLQQKRKMRSGELHYIDHPKMGILVKIEPRTAEQAQKLSGYPASENTKRAN